MEKKDIAQAVLVAESPTVAMSEERLARHSMVVEEAQPVAMILNGADRVEINDFQGASAGHRTTDGKFRLEVREAPPLGTHAEPLVRRTLGDLLAVLDRLAVIRKGTDSRGEDGIIDFVNGNPLELQIVTVPSNSQHGRAVRIGERVTLELTAAAAATLIADAIDHKSSIPRGRRPGIFLALDARHAGILKHAEIIEALRHQRPDLATLGFAEIWLIGPHVASCVQLV